MDQVHHPQVSKAAPDWSGLSIGGVLGTGKTTFATREAQDEFYADLYRRAKPMLDENARNRRKSMEWFFSRRGF